MQRKTIQKLNQNSLGDFSFSKSKTGLNTVNTSQNSIVRMVDEGRQEAISDPTSIFRKLREKMASQPIREKGQRVKEKFKGRTATV